MEASLSYTSGSLSSFDGDIYIWGGKVWEEVAGLVGGIKEDDASENGFTKVNWNGTALGYKNKKLSLGHQHGVIIAEKTGKKLKK